MLSELKLVIFLFFELINLYHLPLPFPPSKPSPCSLSNPCPLFAEIAHVICMYIEAEHLELVCSCLSKVYFSRSHQPLCCLLSSCRLRPGLLSPVHFDMSIVFDTHVSAVMLVRLCDQKLLSFKGQRSPTGLCPLCRTEETTIQISMVNVFIIL